MEVDRAKMADLGLNMSMVGGTMQVAFNGNTDAQYRDGDYEYDINVRMDEFDRKSVGDIEALGFVNNRGELIQLKQFAKVIPSEGPSELQRQDRIGFCNC
ncbi:efflux RND transporter permease subunit [Echinicola jeungdonensis]|uniref:efflux RND transporter permease subunit n=2 Tax=Echinicola jeungdonensis TaxID=709343 RepID=UPI0025B37A10|nr:efflux RND transporter permease subunit [Echinicola jeungdonensis]MDN3671370.1 efflux RND transporter permease subunit [Echinicola jeungdonensis]